MTMSTYPAIFASAGHNGGGLRLDLHVVEEGKAALYRGLHLLGETRNSGPGGPEAGDILYWFACLGAACLLMVTTS